MSWTARETNNTAPTSRHSNAQASILQQQISANDCTRCHSQFVPVGVPADSSPSLEGIKMPNRGRRCRLGSSALPGLLSR